MRRCYRLYLQMKITLHLALIIHVLYFIANIFTLIVSCHRLFHQFHGELFALLQFDDHLLPHFVETGPAGSRRREQIDKLDVVGRMAGKRSTRKPIIHIYNSPFQEQMVDVGSQTRVFGHYFTATLINDIQLIFQFLDVLL